MSVRPQAKDKPSPVNFQWDDPFMLDEQLTEDERMIRDTARAYAQDKLLPRVTKAYLEEKVDRPWVTPSTAEIPATAPSGTGR